MPKDGKNKDWAFEFIQMACSKDWMQRSVERGNAPPRVSVLNHPDVRNAIGWAPVLAEAMQTATLEPREPIWPTMELQLRSGISPVLTGQKNAKDGAGRGRRRLAAHPAAGGVEDGNDAFDSAREGRTSRLTLEARPVQAFHDHAGAIDCDIHPGVPNIKALLPYMDEFWRESFVARGIDGFDMMSYPLGAPITCRPDWRVKGERPGSSLPNMQRDALDAFGISLAICNPLTGGQIAVSETMGAAICSAVNDWIIEHWLNKEPRLRASIVVPGAGAAARGGGDRAPRRRSSLRADPDAGGVRDDAGPQLLLADL